MAVPRVVRHSLLALVPLALLVALAEAALWAADRGGADDWLSLSRGFDRSAAYLVPASGGGWRTQMFEAEELEVDVGLRDERRRAVLLGGSNTQGFPQELLQAALERRDPDPGWEVINLGRQGYGSERVAILAEQVLDRLEPDVLVLYSGHNEFTERGFALRLGEEGATSAVARVADWFGRLRTTRVLAAALRPDLTDRGVDRRPEPRAPRDEAFRRLQYDETLRAFDAYRENLSAIAAACAERGVGLVLGTVVGNDFAAPYVTNYSADDEAADVQRHRRLLARARRLVPARFLEHLVPPVRLRQPDWGMTLRPEEVASRRAAPPAPERRPPTLRPLLGAFAEAPATDAPKARSVEGAHWADPSLWIPAVHDVLETFGRLVARQVGADEVEDLRAARALYVQADALVPDAPQAAFDHGLVAWLLGDDAGALVLLRRAADLDRAPRRGHDLSNGIVRALARAGADRGEAVVLADLEALFRSRHPDGLIGYEVMTDHCHLQPGVRPVMMEDLTPAVLLAHRKREETP